MLSDLCSAPAHVISKRAEASAEGASAGQRDQMTCLVQAATVVKDRYVSLFSKFAACHVGLSTSVSPNVNSLSQLRANISVFLAACRRKLSRVVVATSHQSFTFLRPMQSAAWKIYK